MEYTKGGWKREGNEVKVLGSGTVAVCPSPTTSDGVLEFIANAQLIASAPDLYEACLSALGVMATLDQNKGWVKEIMGVIQKALAKADGK